MLKDCKQCGENRRKRMLISPLNPVIPPPDIVPVVIPATEVLSSLQASLVSTTSLSNYVSSRSLFPVEKFCSYVEPSEPDLLFFLTPLPFPSPLTSEGMCCWDTYMEECG
jgi:hypothetical protein